MKRQDLACVNVVSIQHNDCLNHVVWQLLFYHFEVGVDIYKTLHPLCQVHLYPVRRQINICAYIVET